MKTRDYKLLVALCLLATTPLAAADDGHGHDHPTPTTQANAHAGHDHDHDEDDDHGHDAHDDHGHDHDEDDSHDDHEEHDGHEGHDHHHGHGHDHADGHDDEVVLSAEAIARHGVRIGTASKVVLAATISAPARIAFNTDAMAHVGSAVTGRVGELKVKLGDDVKQGDVLLVVNSPELSEAQSDYLLKRAAVAVAEPAIEPARQSHERAKALLEQSQGIALAEVQKREAELRSAEGALKAAAAAATAAENKLHLYGMTQGEVEALAKTGEIMPQYRVLAPISGQVVEREVTLGELVNPDRDALLIIADLTTLWAIADVPEARIGGIQRGAAARVKMAALGGATLEGTVAYIAAALDPNTRSAKVRVELKDSGGAIRPGMFAQATLLPKAGHDASAVLAIPEEAIQHVEGGPAVFVPVEDEPNTFAKRAVKVGPVIGGMVQVLSGLEEDEELVVSGSFILKAQLGKAGAAHEH